MTHSTILDYKQVTFIGGGNMAGALVDGLLQARAERGLDLRVVVSDIDADKRKTFANKDLLVVAPEDSATEIERSDIVVLAVKPQMMNEACCGIKEALRQKLILSVAAGIGVERLAETTGASRIVRSMPNLPATVSRGATGMFAASANEADRALAEAVMAASGVVVWVEDETHLHAVTAVAGSAPAYFFYMLEHMTQKAQEMGLSEADALALVTQTMEGAAIMAQNADPAELRAKVTSKGGTTHAAIVRLQEDGVGERLAEAMQACFDRSVELGAPS